MRIRPRALVSALILIVFVAGALAVPTLIDRHYNRIRSRPPYQVPIETREFHQTLFVADLHADSLLWGRDLLHRSTTGHVDIPRLHEANVSLQVFSVVTTIPGNLNIERNAGNSDRVRYLSIAEGWPLRTWNSPKERALYQAAELLKFEAQARGDLVI